LPRKVFLCKIRLVYFYFSGSAFNIRTLPSFVAIHLKTSPSLSFKNLKILEGTVVLRRYPLTVKAVSSMCAMSSNFTFCLAGIYPHILVLYCNNITFFVQIKITMICKIKLAPTALNGTALVTITRRPCPAHSCQVNGRKASPNRRIRVKKCPFCS